MTVEDLPADTFVALFFRARAAVEAQHRATLAAKDAEIAKMADALWLTRARAGGGAVKISKA